MKLWDFNEHYRGGTPRTGYLGSRVSDPKFSMSGSDAWCAMDSMHTTLSKKEEMQGRWILLMQWRLKGSMLNQNQSVFIKDPLGPTMHAYHDTLGTVVYSTRTVQLYRRAY
jgi:hypothetical protein